MITIKDCKARYLLGTSDVRNTEQFRQFKFWTHQTRALLPYMIIHDDGRYLWAYFFYPLTYKEKNTILGSVGVDMLLREEILA